MPSKTTKAKPAITPSQKRQARKATAPKTAPKPTKGETERATKLDGGKGYDPSIPLEKRTPEEQQATVVAHGKPADETPAPKARASSKPAKPKTPKASLRTEAEAVLREKGKPMHVKDLTEAVLARGNVKAKGKTPQATLASIMLRSDKFKKTARGTFGLA
jgi:hypothetical protein